MTLNTDTVLAEEGEVPIVDSTSLHPVQGIMETTTLQNVSDLWKFIGTVNQMSKFAPNLEEVTQPPGNSLNNPPE